MELNWIASNEPEFGPHLILQIGKKRVTPRNQRGRCSHGLWPVSDRRGGEGGYSRQCTLP